MPTTHGIYKTENTPDKRKPKKLMLPGDAYVGILFHLNIPVRLADAMA